MFVTWNLSDSYCDNFKKLKINIKENGENICIYEDNEIGITERIHMLFSNMVKKMNSWVKEKVNKKNEEKFIWIVMVETMINIARMCGGVGGGG